MDYARQHGVAASRAVTASVYDRLNHQWHKPGLQVFLVIVLAHWAEHLAQAFQIYVLHWPIPTARGVLGLWLPWLVKSEVLHYLYALIMLTGLWVFRQGTGTLPLAPLTKGE